MPKWVNFSATIFMLPFWKQPGLLEIIRSIHSVHPPPFSLGVGGKGGGGESPIKFSKSGIVGKEGVQFLDKK